MNIARLAAAAAAANLAAVLALALAACQTTAGYNDDLTPDNDGAAWIGGAAIQSYTPAARQAMRAQLAAHPRCAWCGTKDGLEAHHIIPVNRNPALAAEPENLVTLCHECHWVLAHRRDWRKAVWNLRTVIESALEMGPPGGDEP